jgi:hypothetical protein
MPELERFLIILCLHFMEKQKTTTIATPGNTLRPHVHGAGATTILAPYTSYDLICLKAT